MQTKARRRLIHIKREAQALHAISHATYTVTSSTEERVHNNTSVGEAGFVLPPSKMISIFWNCRGLGHNAGTICIVRELSNSHRPDCISCVKLR